MSCNCESCGRVNRNLAFPGLAKPTKADRFTHARHLVRDNPAPEPNTTGWTPPKTVRQRP